MSLKEIDSIIFLVIPAKIYFKITVLSGGQSHKSSTIEIYDSRFSRNKLDVSLAIDEGGQ